MGLPGAEAFESAGLKAWPGIEVEWDGHWVRRASNGYTKRANSVQSLDPGDDDDASARLLAGAAWLAGRGLRPVFRQTPLAGPRTLAALDAAGWRSIDASRQFAMELGSIEADDRGRIFEPLDPVFLSAQRRLQDYSDEQLGRLAAVLGALDVPACGVVVYDDGEPVASSIMSVADGIVITGNVVTDAARRRQGFGSAMMRTGLAWAQREGAIIAALNVAGDNSVGQALYRSLGYRDQYGYVYRVPPNA